MSRTVRRKNTYYPWWIKQKLVENYHREERENEDLKLALVRYHSDSGHGMKSFLKSSKFTRNFFERKLRKESRRELRKAYGTIEHEIILLKKWKLPYA